MSDDKSLEEVIKETKGTKGQQNKRGRGGGANGGGRFQNNNRRFRQQRQVQQRRRDVGGRPRGDNSRFIRRTGPQNQIQNNNNSNSNNSNSNNSRRFQPPQEGKGRVLQIFNLNPDINEDQLYPLVSQYGPVERCIIHRDEKGRSQEKATIIFRDLESTDEAKKDLHRNELEGRTLTVEIHRQSDVAHEIGLPPRAQIQSQQQSQQQQFGNGNNRQGNNRNNDNNNRDRPFRIRRRGFFKDSVRDVRRGSGQGNRNFRRNFGGQRRRDIPW